MQYKSNKGYTGLGQLGMLLLFLGVGVIVGSLVQLIVGMSLLPAGTPITEMGDAMVKAMQQPENVNTLRLLQVISTFIIFFIPAVLYSWVCHGKQPFWLGFNKYFNPFQIIVGFLIIFTANIMAGPLQELSEKTIENTVYPFRTDSTFNSLHAGKYQLTIKDKNNIVCTKDLIINETTDTFTDSTIENRVYYNKLDSASSNNVYNKEKVNSDENIDDKNSPQTNSIDFKIVKRINKIEKGNKLFSITVSGYGGAGPYQYKLDSTYFPSLYKMANNLENTYNEQVNILSNLKGVWDLLLALLIMAFFPALFEELFFRGALQPLLIKWWKKPMIAILVTSIIFSLIHMSIYLFLSRIALGFVLGLMFYETKNIWVNTIAHFLNNAIAVGQMYIMSNGKEKVDVSKLDPKMDWWYGVIAAFVLVALFNFLRKYSEKNKYLIIAKEQELIDNKVSGNPFESSVL